MGIHPSSGHFDNGLRISTRGKVAIEKRWTSFNQVKVAVRVDQNNVFFVVKNSFSYTFDFEIVFGFL